MKQRAAEQLANEEEWQVISQAHMRKNRAMK